MFVCGTNRPNFFRLWERRISSETLGRNLSSMKERIDGERSGRAALSNLLSKIVRNAIQVVGDETIRLVVNCRYVPIVTMG